MSLAHLPQLKKKPTIYHPLFKKKALLTHTLASFWRKQSCISMNSESVPNIFCYDTNCMLRYLWHVKKYACDRFYLRLPHSSRSFTEEVSLWLAKLSLKFNGGLVNLGLIFIVTVATNGQQNIVSIESENVEEIYEQNGLLRNWWRWLAWVLEAKTLFPEI